MSWCLQQTVLGKVAVHWYKRYIIVGSWEIKKNIDCSDSSYFSLKNLEKIMGYIS